MKKTLLENTKLISRNNPCICCSCPECDAIFMAASLNINYNNNNNNEELLNDLAKYARIGYNISVKNSNEFKLDLCTHLKSKKNERSKQI